jgi:hypothetical protein
MSRVISVSLLVILCGLHDSCRADSFGPFLSCRQADRNGRYYVVVKGDPGAVGPATIRLVAVEIAEQMPGSSPVTHARDFLGPDRQEVLPNPAVAVRPGDKLLGRAGLSVLLPTLFVSSTGLGVVVLNVVPYAPEEQESCHALAILSNDGSVRLRSSLAGIFDDDESSRFLRTGTGVRWWSSAWIDEEKEELVVVGTRHPNVVGLSPRPFRTIKLASGRVSDGSALNMVRVLSGKVPGALDDAIELVTERGFLEAKPELLRIFAATKTSPSTRVRAAVALGRLGDRRGADFVRGAAFSNSEDSHYAISGLPWVLGDAAAEFICSHVREFRKPRRNSAFDPRLRAARDAMSLVTATAALPPLISLLKEEKNSGCVEFVLESLGDMGRDARVAVSRMIALLEDAKGGVLLSTKRLAAKALGCVGPEADAALPALERLAERYAPTEWRRVSTENPARRINFWGKVSYSDDDFINAVCKIRAGRAGA